jgi:hypothetical protein
MLTQKYGNEGHKSLVEYTKMLGDEANNKQMAAAVGRPIWRQMTP